MAVECISTAVVQPQHNSCLQGMYSSEMWYLADPWTYKAALQSARWCPTTKYVSCSLQLKNREAIQCTCCAQAFIAPATDMCACCVYRQCCLVCDALIAFATGMQRRTALPTSFHHFSVATDMYACCEADSRGTCIQCPRVAAAPEMQCHTTPKQHLPCPVGPA